jgi:hypothetical protein
VNDETFGGTPERPPRPLPPDQDQRDRQEAWEDDLDSGLVRALKAKRCTSCPCKGSETQCYKNVLNRPSIRIHARALKRNSGQSQPPMPML